LRDRGARAALLPARGGLARYATVSVSNRRNGLRRRNSPVSTLLLVPLEDTVVFPNMNITLAADVGAEQRVLLVPKHENEYAKVGAVAEVLERAGMPGGTEAVAISGLPRGLVGAASTDAEGRLRVEVEEHPDETPAAVKTRELEVEYRAVVEEILELRGA